VRFVFNLFCDKIPSMKIFLDSIGCRLNQAEIERIARQFRAAGHEIVALAKDADLAVVNTCTVTSAAAADSRKVIRRAKKAGANKIIATGCWATIEPHKAEELADKVVLNDKKETLVPDFLNLKPETFNLEPLERIPLPGLRARTRAFIKVQDGCDNECTFCITTIARGRSVSRPLEAILGDIRSALDGGTKEIVLTGVHLGAWHSFLPPDGGDVRKTEGSLGLLIREILSKTSVPRLRLSSLEPWDLEPNLFELWRDPRLMPHLHLPLQSGSDSVLKRMRRKTTREGFRQIVAAARAVMPDVAITTDIIAGFPGETEEEFAETLDFVREIGFAGGHIFTYSPREGTPATRMKNQLPKAIRKERNAILREIFAEMSANYRKKFIGRTMSVLWESSLRKSEAGWELSGLTENYLRIHAQADEPRWNWLDEVLILRTQEDGLYGKIKRTS
jgi:threonylcarbamoyladenosine tRNA methylthiotransferase MtaB